MTEHPITPPPELVQQWWDGTHGALYEFEAVTTQAARWGADQELEACCEWLRKNPDAYEVTASQAVYLDFDLGAARRPKPQSLKEQALDELHISFDRGYLKEGAADTIRRALEQLDD
jgi:hypothetical protein